MKKIKIISDLHLDWDRLVLGREHYDTLVIAGDLYEPYSFYNQHHNAIMLRTINDMKKQGVDIVILRGNHDTWAINDSEVSESDFDGWTYENGNICIAHALYLCKDMRAKFTNPERIMEWVSPCLLNAAHRDNNWGAGHGTKEKPNHFWGLEQIDCDELKEFIGSEKNYIEMYKDKTIYLGHFHSKRNVSNKSNNYKNEGNIKYLYQKGVNVKVDKDGKVW